MSTPYQPRENDARAEEQGRRSWDRPDDGGFRGYGGYGPPPYQQSYGMAAAQEGQRAGQLAIAFGVIGLLSGLGVIFGPLAIWQANRADRAGGVGIGGRVLGWVAIGIAIAFVVLFVAYGVFLFSMVEYMSTEFGEDFQTDFSTRS